MGGKYFFSFCNFLLVTGKRSSNRRYTFSSSWATWRDVLYIRENTPVANRYASSRRDYSYRRRWLALERKMEQKEGEGEEVREAKKPKRIVANICLSVGRRKTARASGATPWERREKSATLTTAVASCRVFRIAFVISLNASLYLFFSPRLCSRIRCTYRIPVVL